MQEPMLLKKKAVVSTGSTFSPTLKSAQVTLSNNNMRASVGVTGGAVFSSNQRSSGKWYAEVIMTQFEGTNSYSPLFGLTSQNTVLNDSWASAGELLWYGTGNQFIYGANGRATYGTYLQGDTIGMACDLDAMLMYFTRNGVALGSINIATYIPGVNLFWFGVCSAHGSVGSTGIVDLPAVPKYLPTDYSLW